MQTDRRFLSLSQLSISNASVGNFFETRVTNFFDCNVFSFTETPEITVCPSSDMSLLDISNELPEYPFASWVSFINDGDVYLQGTPKKSDRFIQGLEFNVYLYNCPYPYHGDTKTCFNFSAITGLYPFWIPDTPPYVISLNNNSEFDSGIQPIYGDTKTTFSGSFYTHGIGDLEGDENTFETYAISHIHTYQSSGHLPPPSWITTIPNSGLLSISAPPGSAGVLPLEQFIYNTEWNGKPDVYNYDMNLVTWESFIWVKSFIQISSQPIQINIPPNIFYTVQSGQTLEIPCSSSALFNAETPITISQLAINNTFTPKGMTYDAIRQTVIFSAEPSKAERGTYFFVLQGCDSPGFICAMIPHCLPASPTCINTTMFQVDYINSPPIFTSEFFPAQTTIESPIQLTNVMSKIYDADFDTQTFSLQRLDGNGILPIGISINSSTGEIQWMPSLGTLVNHDYQFQISSSDHHGGLASQIWTVTLNARPIQISPLPMILISTETGVFNQVSFLPPYKNIDLLPSEYDSFFNLTEFTIPTQLPAFSINFTYNPDAQKFNLECLIPNEFPGSWLIQISHPDSNIAEQTSIQTISPGPQVIRPFILNTGPIGTFFVSDSFDTFFSNPDPLASMEVFLLNLPIGFSQNTSHIFGTVGQHMAGTYSLTAQVSESNVKITVIGLMTIPYPPLNLGNVRINGLPINTNISILSIGTNGDSLIDFSETAIDPEGKTPSFSFSEKPSYCDLINPSLWQCLPSVDDQGLFNFSLSINNNHGDVLIKNFSVLVPSYFPRFLPVSADKRNIISGELSTLEITATSPNGNSDIQSLDLIDSPNFCSFRILQNNFDGLITCTPKNPGSFLIKMQASNLLNMTTDLSLNMTVSPNAASTIKSFPIQESRASFGLILGGISSIIIAGGTYGIYKYCKARRQIRQILPVRETLAVILPFTESQTQRNPALIADNPDNSRGP